MVKIIIRGELCEPPSSVTCFRDVTLYGNCFLKADVLLESPRGMKDIYYHWLRDHGAYDFVKGIIRRDEDYGFRVGPEKANFIIDRIVPENLSAIVRRLSGLRGL